MQWGRGAEPPAGRATQGPPADWMLANDAATALVHEVYRESVASVFGGAAELEEETADLALAQPKGELPEEDPEPTYKGSKPDGRSSGHGDHCTCGSHQAGPDLSSDSHPAMTAHGLLQDAWPERDEVGGAEAMAMREKEVEYASRRRAEPASREELLDRAFPVPHPAAHTEAKACAPRILWPEGAPARLIAIAQLYNEGVYAEIQVKPSELNRRRWRTA